MTNEAPAAPLQPPHPHWRRHVSLFLGGQTVTLFGSMLDQAIVSVFAGVWADRTNRKWLIVGADAAIAVSTLALALVLLAGSAEVWVICATLAIRSVGARIQTPAVSALIPQITPANQLMRVNGIPGSLQSALALLAPAVAGGIDALAASGAGGSPLALLPVFAIDIVTAGIGIGLVVTIPVAAVRAADVTSGCFEDLVDGVRAMWRPTRLCTGSWSCSRSSSCSRSRRPT